MVGQVRHDALLRARDQQAGRLRPDLLGHARRTPAWPSGSRCSSSRAIRRMNGNSSGAPLSPWTRNGWSTSARSNSRPGECDRPSAREIDTRDRHQTLTELELARDRWTSDDVRRRHEITRRDAAGMRHDLGARRSARGTRRTSCAALAVRRASWGRVRRRRHTLPDPRAKISTDGQAAVGPRDVSLSGPGPDNLRRNDRIDGWEI